MWWVDECFRSTSQVLSMYICNTGTLRVISHNRSLPLAVDIVVSALGYYLAFRYMIAGRY